MTEKEQLIELLSKPIPMGRRYEDVTDYEVRLSDAASEILADHLLSNGVIVPPCKVGDSCYPLDASETALTCEETISRITISERNIIIGYYEHWDYSKRCRKTDNWRLPLRTRIFGKGVFLTKEEAEKALKEREQK